MKRAFTITACGAIALIVGLTASAVRADEKPADTRVFELRTYTTNEGKLDELHKRFREHTNKIFVKHGMELIGYWTPTDGPEAGNTLIYMLAFPDQASRDKAWDAFRDDPEWQAVYKASTAEGRLVKQVKSQMCRPTDYSPIQ